MPLIIDLLLSGGVGNGLESLMHWRVHSGFSTISACRKPESLLLEGIV
jgi:hypothetical protein